MTSEQSVGATAYIYEQKIDDGFWDEKAKTEHPSVYLDDDHYRNVREMEVKND